MTRFVTGVAVALLTALGAGRAGAAAEVAAVVELWADPTVGLVAPKPDEVQSLTDQLRTELSATGRFAVVPAREVEVALTQRGVTARACDRPCLVEVGRAVGADQVVSGRVVRMMTLLWGVDLQVTDVASGSQVGGAGEFKGDYLVLKSLGIRQLVREMTARPAGAGN
jgi:hypothetical protein